MDLELLNKLHPVGSIFETNNAAFDPNVAWGGTWVKDSSGTVLVSWTSATNSVFSGAMSSIVGSAKATANAPQHYHSALVRMLQPTGSTQGSVFTKGTVIRGINNGGDRVFEYYGGGIWTSNSVGGGQPHNNMMYYRIVARWIRTA